MNEMSGQFEGDICRVDTDLAHHIAVEDVSREHFRHGVDTFSFREGGCVSVLISIARRGPLMKVVGTLWSEVGTATLLLVRKGIITMINIASTSGVHCLVVSMFLRVRLCGCRAQASLDPSRGYIVSRNSEHTSYTKDSLIDDPACGRNKLIERLTEAKLTEFGVGKLNMRLPPTAWFELEQDTRLSEPRKVVPLYFLFSTGGRIRSPCHGGGLGVVKSLCPTKKSRCFKLMKISTLI